jgi:ABC-type nitrate/sulfonate/bicarbonate transport system substrate-binding protein
MRIWGARLVPLLLAMAIGGCGANGGATGEGHIVGDQEAGDSGFTKWGWPLPYEKVSDKSIEWLKKKGWWPLKAGYQSPFSGQNNVNVVMWKEGLMQRRGVEATWQPFASGPEVNEAFLAGQLQVGNGGNFPFTSLLAANAPVKCLSVLAPNLLHAVMAPKDSKLESFRDLKGSGATVGIVAGSSAEFYFQSAAQSAGIETGRDVTLKNMEPPEQQTLPKGIDAVVPWDPTPTFMLEQIKNAKVVDSIFPYNFYMGCFYVHADLIENAPDVVQAIVDAHQEAILLSRYDVDGTVKDLKEDPNLKSIPDAILKDQVEKYNNLYKPTFAYPFRDFWPKENERIAKFLTRTGRLKGDVDAATWSEAMDASFMDKTFRKLGWQKPDRPPFIPADWEGELGNVPYPRYDNIDTLSGPQRWPEEGDLSKEWEFDGKKYRP